MAIFHQPGCGPTADDIYCHKNIRKMTCVLDLAMIMCTTCPGFIPASCILANRLDASSYFPALTKNKNSENCYNKSIVREVKGIQVQPPVSPSTRTQEKTKALHQPKTIGNSTIIMIGVWTEAKNNHLEIKKFRKKRIHIESIAIHICNFLLGN